MKPSKVIQMDRIKFNNKNRIKMFINAFMFYAGNYYIMTHSERIRFKFEAKNILSTLEDEFMFKRNKNLRYTHPKLAPDFVTHPDNKNNN